MNRIASISESIVAFLANGQEKREAENKRADRLDLRLWAHQHGFENTNDVSVRCSDLKQTKRLPFISSQTRSALQNQKNTDFKVQHRH